VNSWLRDLFHSQVDEPIDDPIEETEEKEESQSKKITGLVELTDDERSFLVSLVDSGLKEFIYYPENVETNDSTLKQILGQLSKEKSVSVISSLEEKKLLHRKKLEPTLQCPKCYSKDIKVKFSCPRCSSNDITKSEIYEHPYCGYRNIKSEFQDRGSLVCPKCRSSLTKRVNSIDDVDQGSYRVIGSVFECNSCHNKVNKPNIDFQCRNCGNDFNYVNAIYQVPLKYIISDRVVKRIQSRNQVNLLIVEDFTPEAEVMSIILNDYDSDKEYNITIVANGSEALKNFEENDFNLVILDLGLPDMSGLEVLEKIKKSQPEVQVIVYTGQDDREIAVKAMKMGASEFLIKNYEDIQTLPKIVEKVLSDDILN
jgi:CheY-like chemotaxis protein